MEAVGIDVYNMIASSGWEIYPYGSNAKPEDIPVTNLAGLVLDSVEVALWRLKDSDSILIEKPSSSGRQYLLVFPTIKTCDIIISGAHQGFRISRFSQLY